MTLYAFFSDPLWQSIGVILGAAGVFGGAYLGSTLGYKATLKAQKQQLLESKDNLIYMVILEINFNRATLHKIDSYLVKNPPIETAFDVAEIGSQHIKFDAWNLLIESGVFNILTVTEQMNLLNINGYLRHINQTFQLETADWKRIFAFHQYYQNNPPNELTQPLGNLRDISDTKLRNLKNDIKKAIHQIESIDVSDFSHDKSV